MHVCLYVMSQKLMCDTDREKLYDAPNQGFGSDIELFKFIKSNENLEGCARIIIFRY